MFDVWLWCIPSGRLRYLYQLSCTHFLLVLFIFHLKNSDTAPHRLRRIIKHTFACVGVKHRCWGKAKTKSASTTTTTLARCECLTNAPKKGFCCRPAGHPGRDFPARRSFTAHVVRHVVMSCVSPRCCILSGASSSFRRGAGKKKLGTSHQLRASLLSGRRGSGVAVTRAEATKKEVKICTKKVRV